MVEHPANALQQDPLSHGLWARSAPEPPSSGTLTGTVKADVMVVGAGYTGLAAALRLAEKGASVAVLEARAIGYGASGRNVGLVNAGLWLSPREVIDRLGNDYGERLMKHLGEAPGHVFDLIESHDMQCEANRAGTLHCAHSRRGFEDLQQRARDWSSLAAPVELLDGSDAAVKIGSDYFHGALLDHRAGTVQPLGYARGLGRAAVRAGARLFTRSAVRSLSRRNGEWLAETDGGSATAPSVIIATNAYTTTVAPIDACVVPFSFFQLATRPLPPRIQRTILQEGHGAWDTAKILTSLRLDAAGRLIVGSIGKLDRRHRGIHANWMRRKIRQVFPQLGGVSFEHGWDGMIATTRDHLPRLSQPDHGAIAAYGYNGRGIGTGTVFGHAMADYILNRDIDDLPLPLTAMSRESMRLFRALGIELGARAYHFVSNRF
ncbi:MAG: Gamma-glutamylputrescine oxidoreductase [Gammaproteobacteria bacterium]|nr:Gamma-glutamylputrescine oxidoreductase [Gammaproteobacteria bacterium]